MQVRNSPIASIDRSLLLLKPTQTLVDWVNAIEKKLHPGDYQPFSLEEEFKYQNAYLVPEMEEPKEMTDWLKQNFLPIFEEELSAWYNEPALWPKAMEWAGFQTYFEISFIEMVFDLVDED